jgi:hypothetical protein
MISGVWGYVTNKHLAEIPGTGFLLNTQSYGRLHCLPHLSRIRDNTGYTESQIIPNTSKKVSNSGISLRNIRDNFLVIYTASFPKSLA